MGGGDLPASGTGVGSQRRGAGKGVWEEWEGSPGRRNSRNQGSEERLTWWRGFCDCCFCPPWTRQGLGAVGAAGRKKRPVLSWRSSGREPWCRFLPLPHQPPARPGVGAHFSAPEASLGPSLGPGASAWTALSPGVGGGCPWPARPISPSRLLQHRQQPLLHCEGRQRAHHQVPPPCQPCPALLPHPNSHI